ncbi:MAG: VWA domain-containing protein [Chitinophagales bacterium]
MNKKYIAIVFLLLFQFTSFVYGNGFIMSPPAENYWRPDPKQNYLKPFPENFNPCVIALQSEDTDVTIENGKVNVSTIQRFYNTSADTIHAYYLFTVPKGLKFTEFLIKVDSVKYRHELYTENQSYSVFRDIVKVTSNPAYWEYADQDVYKVSIYNALPRATKLVQLSYSYEVENDGQYTRFGHIFSTQNLAKYPPRKQSFNVTFTSKEKLGTVSVPTHDVKIEKISENSAKFSLKAAQKNMGNDLSLFFNTKERAVGYSLFSYKKAGEDGYFLLNFDAGFFEKADESHKDVTFVLDASQDMPAAKLAQITKVISESLGKLTANDRFNIIRYSNTATSLFPDLEEAKASNVIKAISFLEQKSAGGACNYEAALEKVLAANIERVRPYYVYWVAASDATAGETTDPDDLTDMIEDANLRNMRIFTLGVGDKINTILLDKFSNFTRSYSTYIAAADNASETTKRLLEQTSRPVMINMQLYLEDNLGVTDMLPKKPNNLFYQYPLSFIGRYKKSGKSTVSIVGDQHKQMRRYQFDLEFADDDQTYHFVPKLWAARQIGFLINEVRLEYDDPEDAGDEIVELAKEHFIINPYTVHLMQKEFEFMKEEQKAILPRFITQSATDYAKAFDAIEETSGIDAVNISKVATALTHISSESDFEALHKNMSFKDEKGKVQNNVASDYTYINNQLFYHNTDGIWVQKGCENSKDEPVKLPFTSEEYFNFINSHTDVLPFLYLGEHIRFMAADGKLCEITEAPPRKED